jgi:hypothetical protein
MWRKTYERHCTALAGLEDKELARRPRLRHLLGRNAEPVGPSHQGGVQGRRDRQNRAVAASTLLFQQVTWKSPIFFTCDLLNTWIASGVGCNRTLQSFFAK